MADNSRNIKAKSKEKKVLTEAIVKDLNAKAKMYKLIDYDGLYIVVKTNGRKYWWYRYQMDNKFYELQLGQYPEVNLLKARRLRDNAKEERLNGRNPFKLKQDAKQESVDHSFSAVSHEWFNIKSKDFSKKYNQKLIYYIDKILCPAFGSLKLDEISPQMILDCVKSYQLKEQIYTAHKIIQTTGQIFDYSIIKGLTKYNVARGLTKALTAYRENNLATFQNPSDMGRFLRAIDNYEGFFSIIYFLKILPHIFTRPSELRLAKWEEVDFDKAVLTIPANRLKIKKYTTSPHLVPLSKQVLGLFNELKRYAQSDFCFPSIRAKTDTISDAGPLNAIRDMGFKKEEITLHGFRHFASTQLNEMGFRPDVIEKQLSHLDQNKIRSVYNKAEYWPERVAMMQKWSDYLDSLKEGKK